MTIPSVPLLEAVHDVSSAGRKVPASTFLPRGSLAVVDQGRELVAGYTDDQSMRFAGNQPVIIFGDHTRVVKYVDFPFAIGADGVKVLGARDGFDPKFVFRYLQAQHVPGSGYSRHFKFLKRITVPRPSLAYQTRVAMVLDRAEELLAVRDEVDRRLDAMPAAIFREMFGDPGAAPRTVPFGEIAALRGGRNLVADDLGAASDYRVLKISAVTSGVFRPEESKPLPADYRPPAAHLVRPGDLLMSRANTTELVGAVAHVGDVSSTFALPDKIWRFDWADPRSVPEFYHALFSSPPVRRTISRMSSGTGGSMKNVSKEKLSNLALPVVSIDEQRRFAERVRAIPRPETGVLDELFACLQNRAFRGDL